MGSRGEAIREDNGMGRREGMGWRMREDTGGGGWVVLRGEGGLARGHGGGGFVPRYAGAGDAGHGTGGRGAPPSPVFSEGRL